MSERELLSERPTVETYCQLLATVTPEAFGVVKTLDADPDAGGTA